MPANAKRILGILFLASLGFASAVYAGTLSWDLPTTYADGTPIAAAESRKIVVEVYAGPSRSREDQERVASKKGLRRSP